MKQLLTGVAMSVAVALSAPAWAQEYGPGITPSRDEPSSSTGNPEACRTDWRRCADNEQLATTYSNWVHVQGECKRAATKMAEYGSPEWPWHPFGSFHSGNDYVKSGRAILIEPDAQFSNVFGAMVHSRVVCTYDLRGDRVLDVQVLPR